MSEISIERARDCEITEILEIMKTANMHRVPSPEMPELDWRCLFVARISGKIVGAAGYKVISPTEAKTTLMCVHPEYRRFGIGKALQEKRMLALCDQGIKTLITNADIPETIAWYKRHFGYEEVGRLKKLHEFGRADIDEWTTLRTDLGRWEAAHGKHEAE